MTNTRMINDIATTDRREMADATMKENRIRNDELTRERREKADRTMDMNRSRNDELTTNRRERKDRNPWRTLVVSILVIAALAVGAYLIFI